jgi:undecaprenyl-diphosphatase
VRWIHLVLLGVIQGLTEFLPISSDGHLAIAQLLLGISEDNLAITVALHSGTLLAVILYFRSDLLRIARALPSIAKGGAAGDRRLLVAIVAGSVPTAVIGIALKGPTQALSSNLWAIGAFLLLSGAWNWVVVRKSLAAGETRGTDTLKVGDALAIGVVQGLAVMPGLSRSGSTIGMGTALGLSRDAAARYSFLLSLPAVGGALLLEAKDISSFPMNELGPVILGSVVSFAVGLVALVILFRVLRKGRFDVFAFYCWALACAVFFAAYVTSK